MRGREQREKKRARPGWAIDEEFVERRLRVELAPVGAFSRMEWEM